MYRATVLLGHGSRRGEATRRGLEEIRIQIQGRMGRGHPVFVAGLEFTEPSLETLMDYLARRGVRQAVVAPLFLFDGRHVVEEIPELMERIARRHPSLTAELARTLGLDERLVRAAARRVDEALTGRYCGRDRCACASGYHTEKLGIVVVNRGSRRQYDPGLRLMQIAGLLRLQLGGNVAVAWAQAEYEEPTIAQALDTVIACGVDTVVVMPYLLFEGKVTEDNISPEVTAARHRFPLVKILMSKTLGPSPELVEVALDRIYEAWGRIAVMDRG